MNKKKVISTILFVLLGGIFGYYIGKVISGNIPEHLFQKFHIAMILLVFPAFFFVIAWHEAGHAVAGLSQKFDFRMYIVGLLMWEKQHDKWHFSWNKNINTAGGMVVCLPTDKINLRQKFIIYAAGGPVASLILVVISYGIYIFSIDRGNVAIILGIFSLMIAFFSFLIFIATVIPLHTGGFYTDGARILRLLQGGNKSKFDILILNIIAQSSSGVRPKMLNISELEEALSIAKQINEPFGVYLHSFLHQLSFDKGDYENAEQHLLNYIAEIEHIPAGIESMVWLDAAFFYAFAKRDIAKAKEYMAKFKPTPIIPKAQELATEAILHFLEKDLDNTLVKIEAARKELPKMIDKGVAIALEEKLTKLKSECNSLRG
jgi:hypothetical protein